MNKTLKYLLIIAFVSFVGVYAIYNKSEVEVVVKEEGSEQSEDKIISINTLKLDSIKEVVSGNELVGIVKPAAQIDVVSLGAGNIESLNFSVGDRVQVNQRLASLYDLSTLVNLNNAQANIANTRNNKSAVERLADESIRQVEISKRTALESIQQAKVALQSAEGNYENVLVLQKKAEIDAVKQAESAYYNYRNIIRNGLDQVNYILDVEDGAHLDSIDRVIGVKNKATVDEAELAYSRVKLSYDDLISLELSKENIRGALNNLINTLNQLRAAVSSVNNVLENTITSSEFSMSDLAREKTTYYNLESSVIGAVNNAITTLQNLETIPLVNKQEADALKSSVESARVQLEIANLSFANAEASLQSAKLSKAQQTVGVNSSISTAQGQLNIAQTQLEYLSISSPISGTVIEKYVENGSKVNPGQKIAKVAQTEFVKIEVDVQSSKASAIKVGDQVIINDGLFGFVDSVSPSASAVSRKVKVEVLYDNSDNVLVSETFVNIKFINTDINNDIVRKILIPLNSVIITQSEHFVFILDDEYLSDSNDYITAVRKVNVKLGEIDGDRVEILEGLKKSDELVVENVDTLKDGAIVKIKI